MNLLTDKWIPVLSQEKMELFSMADCLKKGGHVSGFASESIAMDFMLMRQLMALMIVLLYGWNVQGEKREVSGTKDLMERWKCWKNLQKVPDFVLDSFIEEYRDCFEFSCSALPFLNISQELDDLIMGMTRFSLDKLDPAQNGSSLKPSFNHAKEAASDLNEETAARWMLYRNFYADTASHPGVGMGIGLSMDFVWVQTDNLFETLMLNLCPVHVKRDCQKEEFILDLHGKPNPLWMQNFQELPVRIHCYVPDNLPELYTFLARHLSMVMEDGKPVGFMECGARGFSKDNAWMEPFALWKRNEAKEKKNAYLVYSSFRMESWDLPWSHLDCLLDERDTLYLRNGLMNWLAYLQDQKDMYDLKSLNLRFLSAVPGSSNMNISCFHTGELSIPCQLIKSAVCQDSFALQILDLLFDVRRMADCAGKLYALCKGIQEGRYGFDAGMNSSYQKEGQERFCLMADGFVRMFLHACENEGKMQQALENFKKGLHLCIERYTGMIMQEFAGILYGYAKVWLEENGEMSRKKIIPVMQIRETEKKMRRIVQEMKDGRLITGNSESWNGKSA